MGDMADWNIEQGITSEYSDDPKDYYDFVYREECSNWRRYKAKRPPRCGCFKCADKYERLIA